MIQGEFTNLKAKSCMLSNLSLRGTVQRLRERRWALSERQVGKVRRPARTGHLHLLCMTELLSPRSRSDQNLQPNQREMSSTKLNTSKTVLLQSIHVRAIWTSIRTWRTRLRLRTHSLWPASSQRSIKIALSTAMKMKKCIWDTAQRSKTSKKS